MSYQQLSFENDLFTTHVYKRNYRTRLIHQSLQQKSSADHKTSLKKETLDTDDTEFFYACAIGDCQTVEKLLQDGQNVHTSFHSRDIRNLYRLVGDSSFRYQFRAIDVAASTSNVEVAKTLLKYGASPDGSGHDHPLRLAARLSSICMVDLLLRHGARVHAESHCGYQAIHYAAWAGCISVISRLLDAGANLRCQDWLGYLPEDWAFWRYLENKEAFALFPKSLPIARRKAKILLVDGLTNGITLTLQHRSDEPSSNGIPSIVITTVGPFEQPDSSYVQQTRTSNITDESVASKYLEPRMALPFGPLRGDPHWEDFDGIFSCRNPLGSRDYRCY